MEVGRAAELLGGGLRVAVGSAVSPIANASAASASAWPLVPAIRVSASAQRCAHSRSPRCAKKPRRPAQRRHAHSGGPRCVSHSVISERANATASASRRPRAAATRASPVTLSIVMWKWLACVARRDGRRRAAAAPTRSLPCRRGWRRSVPRHPHGRALGDQLAATSSAPRPLAALAQHVDHAGDAGELASPPRSSVRQMPSAVSSASCGAAVVGRLVEHHAEPLVELGRDRDQVCSSASARPRRHGSRPCAVVAAGAVAALRCPSARIAQVEPPGGSPPRGRAACASSIASPCWACQRGAGWRGRGARPPPRAGRPWRRRPRPRPGAR